MQSALIGILAVLDLLLGALLYVTIRQIKLMDEEIGMLHEFQIGTIKRNASTDSILVGLSREIDLCKRDNATTYELAAECRNELARLHMAERKEGANVNTR